MVPRELKRHLESEKLDLFKETLDLNQRQQDRVFDCVKVSDKVKMAQMSCKKCFHAKELTTC